MSAFPKTPLELEQQVLAYAISLTRHIDRIPVPEPSCEYTRGLAMICAGATCIASTLDPVKLPTLEERKKTMERILEDAFSLARRDVHEFLEGDAAGLYDAPDGELAQKMKKLLRELGLPNSEQDIKPGSWKQGS